MRNIFYLEEHNHSVKPRQLNRLHRLHTFSYIICNSSGKLFALMRVRLSLVENPNDSSIVPLAFVLPLGLGFILSEVMLFLDGIKVASIRMVSLHLCQFYTLVGPDLSQHHAHQIQSQNTSKWQPLHLHSPLVARLTMDLELLSWLQTCLIFHIISVTSTK